MRNLMNLACRIHRMRTSITWRKVTRSNLKVTCTYRKAEGRRIRKGKRIIETVEDRVAKARNSRINRRKRRRGLRKGNRVKRRRSTLSHPNLMMISMGEKAR